MISIRVWNIVSDNDTKAVDFLKDEFLEPRLLGHLAIQSAGRSAFRKCHRWGAPVNESLKKAIQHYLKQDDFIVFVTDVGNSKPQNQKLIEHIKNVVEDNDFTDKIYFLPDIQENKSTVDTSWQDFVSAFHAEVDNNRTHFQRELDKTMARFHDAFADTPEEEVIRDFEEAIAEVRRERT